jgi:hypothetical protein
MSSTAQSIDLELSLTKLIAVIGPFAKAIQCLESPHTNPADVYLYWLAIVSQLAHLFSHNRAGLSAETMEDIRAITNKRFDQMINKSPNDVYITAFFLNPRTLEASPDNFHLTVQLGCFRSSWRANFQEYQSTFYPSCGTSHYECPLGLCEFLFNSSDTRKQNFGQGRPCIATDLKE